MKRRSQVEASVPAKANRILNGILVALVLILIRVWHLAIIQHDEKVEASKKPQRKVVIEKADRASIVDRYNIPLAVNKVQYNVSISYAGIREIPRSIWTRNSEGKKVKCYARKEYITNLATLLADELGMEPERMEDIIHSKASLFGSMPFVIKENIPEETFYRLKMLEKDWPGLYAEMAAKRCYPKGKVGGEIVGYLGAISSAEYGAIRKEIKELRRFVNSSEEGEEVDLPLGFNNPDEVDKRLEELERKAYALSDVVGKGGVEKSFEEKLRGAAGLKTYLCDIRGNFERLLAGAKEKESGSSLELTISTELQEYAERLLIENEQDRPANAKKRALMPDLQPWIRGGAIVAIDPNDGAVLALATYPRFDPNDFIKNGSLKENAKKNEKIRRWLENESYLGSIWDGKEMLRRERFDVKEGFFFDESKEFSWDVYLNLILPKTSSVRQTLDRIGSVEDAVYLQTKVDELLKLFKPLSPIKVFDLTYSDATLSKVTITIPEKEFFQTRYMEVQERVEELKQQLFSYFYSLPLNYEKLLLTDIMRVAVDHSRFSPALLEVAGKEKLADYKLASSSMVLVQDAVKQMMKDLFHETHFKNWKEKEFKDYLAEKRKEEEKSKKKYAKPYIEYLDEKENEMFSKFWESYSWDFMLFFLKDGLSMDRGQFRPYLETLVKWKNRAETEEYASLPWVAGYRRLKKCIDDKTIPTSLSYLKSLRGFEDLTRPLLGRYSALRKQHGKQLERHLATAFYPLNGYGYLRSQAFRQATSIGSIFKLVPAYEALRQRYHHSQAKGIKDLNPLTIIDDKHMKGADWNVGFTLDRKPIPRFYRGGLMPRSEHAGIGEVDLIQALAASSNPYFSILLGDVLEDPEDVCHAAEALSYGEKTGIEIPGEYAGHLPWDVSYNRSGLYSLAIGQHSLAGTPLQTASMLVCFANGGKVLKPQIVKGKREEKREIFLPKPIQETLFQGLSQVIMSEKGTGRFLKQQFSPAFLKEVIGKTSTAESIEQLSLDGTNGCLKLKHISFGAISFKEGDFERPELVVVVYSRLGDYGKDVAPMALKMIQKWREIEAKYKD